MRVGESVWHASRIREENATIAKYEKPKEIQTRFNYFTVMPSTSRGFAEVMKYGEDVDSTWTVIANDRAFHGKIKVGDLFWLDGDKPSNNCEINEYFDYAESATAVVKSVSYVNITMAITLTRNKDQVKQ